MGGLQDFSLSCLSNQVTSFFFFFFFAIKFPRKRGPENRCGGCASAFPAQTRLGQRVPEEMQARQARVLFRTLLLHLYLQLRDEYEYRYLELLESPVC